METQLSPTPRSYLAIRYQKALKKHLATLPDTMPRHEKEVLLKKTLEAMMEHDRATVKSHVLRRISTLQAKKLELVTLYLTNKDDREAQVLRAAILS